MFIYIGMQFMYLGYCKSNVNNNFESSCKHFHYNLRNQPTNISLLFFIQIPLHGVSQKGYIIHNKTIERLIEFPGTFFIMLANLVIYS